MGKVTVKQGVPSIAVISVEFLQYCFQSEVLFCVTLTCDVHLLKISEIKRRKC